MNIEEQKAVMSCFKTAQKLWDEADIMAERLLDLLKKDVPESFKIIDSGLQYGYDVNFGDLVHTDEIRTIKLKNSKNRTKKVDATIGFQISFIGDGCDIQGNESPLLHMFYVESFEPDFDDDEYFGFPGDYGEYTVEEDRLAVHRDEGRIVDCFYSLRFLSMSNEHELKKYCVNPLINIVFKKSGVKDALPDDYLKNGVLVNLPDINKLIDQED